MSVTLFVAGFSEGLRSDDLRQTFEQFGKLVRCDIPAPKTPSSKPFGFLEYETPEQADAAYRKMHQQTLEGDSGVLNVQFAKNAPKATWRHDSGYFARTGRRSPPRQVYTRGRSRSPPPRMSDRHFYSDRPPPPPLMNHHYPPAYDERYDDRRYGRREEFYYREPPRPAPRYYDDRPPPMDYYDRRPPPIDPRGPPPMRRRSLSPGRPRY